MAKHGACARRRAGVAPTAAKHCLYKHNNSVGSIDGTPLLLKDLSRIFRSLRWTRQQSSIVGIIETCPGSDGWKDVIVEQQSLVEASCLIFAVEDVFFFSFLPPRKNVRMHDSMIVYLLPRRDYLRVKEDNSSRRRRCRRSTNTCT